MDFEEKDERMVEMEARMYAPLEWSSPPACKIQDLKEPQFDEALRLIKHHYFREEPMCKASFLSQEPESVRCYLNLIRTCVKDNTSLVALSPESGRVVGVAVTRINLASEKIDTYARVQILEGKALKRIMHLRNTLTIQACAHDRLGLDCYLLVQILWIHPSYQSRGISGPLLNACLELAQSLGLRAVCGIFTSGPCQATATGLGFRLLEEITYSRWIVEDRVVFDDPGRGNYSAAFMAVILPEEIGEQQSEPAD